MFFVHPQIKIERKNLKEIFLNFFRSTDLENLKKRISFFFPEKELVFVDMGRTALKLIIEELNLQNSQIIFPAYICDIFYPIIKQYNIQPIFLDNDLKNFNIQINSIRKKITPDTKAILVCHTYGLPVDIDKIKIILNENKSSSIKPFIIEDCAHSFGAKYQGKFTGNFGQASLFSLYKQFPAFRGGMLVSPKDWQINLPKTSFDLRDFLSFLNSFSFFAFLFKMFGQDIAPKMIRKEKTNKAAGINSVSLNFFNYFLDGFEESLKRRIDLALFFQKELEKLGFETQEAKNNVFCYLSALVPKDLKEKRDRIVNDLRQHRIFATRIWHTPIILNEEVQKEYKINLDEFPNTVEIAKRIINFPLQNCYTKDDIKTMISSIDKILAKI